MTANEIFAADVVRNADGVFRPACTVAPDMAPETLAFSRGRPLFRDLESLFIARLELQLREQIMELQASNERLKAEIVEQKHEQDFLRLAAAAFNSHEAILITDAQACIIRVNQAFSDITGYLPEEVLGRNPRIMSSGRHGREFYAQMWRRLREEGKWSGEIWDKRKNGQDFPKWISITAVKSDANAVSHYVAIFSDITSRKQAEEEIRYLAFHDALTRLPNRRLFLERLHTAVASSARYRSYGAILFIDLDNFKAINDTHGHDCGDELLRNVGERIRAGLREIDTVARFGGDEFVVLVEGISRDGEDAANKLVLVIDKLRSALAQPFEFKEVKHQCTLSIGISLFHGNEVPVEILLEQADMAMYQAKKAGRNAVRFFNAPWKKVAFHPLARGHNTQA
jgi:diguanylate cyclase (GGDEF)-like protein/PAS domain S-box-containing protein